jgi:hypothetical protein
VSRRRAIQPAGLHRVSPGAIAVWGDIGGKPARRRRLNQKGVIKISRVVTLGAAKGLHAQNMRFFASLRMTSTSLVTPPIKPS